MIRRIGQGLLVTALLSACSTLHSAVKGPAESPETYLSTVEHAANATPTAVTLGRAALATYLITGDPVRAWASGLIWALTQSPCRRARGTPYKASGLRARRSDDRGVAEAALAMLKNVPNTSFAELAAVRLREVAGQSPALDSLILDGLTGFSGTRIIGTRRPCRNARAGNIDRSPRRS